MHQETWKLWSKIKWHVFIAPGVVVIYGTVRCVVRDVVFIAVGVSLVMLVFITSFVVYVYR